MRIVIATLAATLALALAAAAAGAKAPRVVHFTATSTMQSSGGTSLNGTFQSRRLGSGTVRYTSKPAGDASVTRCARGCGRARSGGRRARR
jgi:hypothetical protein